MPGAGMIILFVWCAGRQGIERRLLPEARGQRWPAETHIELLALLYHPFWRFRFEWIANIEPIDLHHRIPFLSPAVRQPVGGQLIGHRHTILLRQFVTR